MPFHPENLPAELEEHPVLSPLLSSSYGWPEEIVAALEADIARHRQGGDAA